jgi:DNA-binding PadR family transcriptional regulator
VFLILTILAGEELHGYGIMQEAGERSGGQIRLQAGALYRRLKWMLDQGFIRETPPPTVPEGEGERRRYYQVTSFGRRVAEAEARRMVGLLSAARRAALIRGPAGP